MLFFFLLKSILFPNYKDYMFASFKALLIGLPLIAQIGIAGSSVVGISATGVAMKQASVCHQQPVVTTHYTQTLAVNTPVTTVEDGTLEQGQEKVITAGAQGQQKVAHTVTKHCGKFLKDTASNPVVVKNPVIEVKNIGTGYTLSQDSPIDFGIQKLPDASQLNGTSGIKAAGVAGVKRTTFHFAKNAGQDQTKTFISEAVFTPPVDRIDWYGTKEAAATLPVKLSRTGICHAPGTTYYNRTLYYTPYSTLDECLQNGRLPLR